MRADDGSVRQMRVFAEPVLSPAGTTEPIQGAFQDVSAEYHTQVALAATRDRLVDTEQRVAEEHLLAVRLQEAIMPPTAEPVAAAGIEVAVRYRPVGPGHLVGGDWYDTLLLPTQEVLLVVGDIAGHGIDAVTGMVIARNCLRGLAITGAGPAELLAYLNSAICHLIDGVVGTVVCGLYDPGRRVLRWARAGHLPPVMIRDGAAVTLPLPHGVLLGTDPDAGLRGVHRVAGHRGHAAAVHRRPDRAPRHPDHRSARRLRAPGGRPAAVRGGPRRSRAGLRRLRHG